MKPRLLRLLIARSSGLSSYDRDYTFTAQQQKTWDASGMEEALIMKPTTSLKSLTARGRSGRKSTLNI